MSHPLALPLRNKWLLKLVESITKVGFLRRLYDQWLTQPEASTVHNGAAFLNFVLSGLKASLNTQNDENLNNIPTTGPLIVVSNHPLGGLEGMLLTQMLLKVRPDVKVLTNDLLLRFPEFSELFIGVDVLGEHKTQENAQGIRQVAQHLKNQGAILIFPAGTVSTINVKKLAIEDAPWHDIIGKLALKYQAACLPIYVSGRNHLSFYLTGLIHKRLRTALLGRAMVTKPTATITAYIGETLPANELKQFKSAAQLKDYLRVSSEMLSHSETHPLAKPSPTTPIKPHVEQSQLMAQLDNLNDYCLLQQGKFRVFCAPYNELGCLMEQIAICREETFRAVDEGTGKELDSDLFDPYYWQLWLWDDDANEMVGGYRLGQTEQIISRHGIDKLYSRSLYKYDKRFINELEGTIEVGRSYIRPAYQSNPKVLDLLWRGIGMFVVEHPQYHTLFGCVSVSKQYSMLARAFLADTLLQNFPAQQNLRESVTPATPFDVNVKPWTDTVVSEFCEIPIINKLLGRIDAGKRIPILIRHYLALNGRFISFTVNKAFNDSLDGLLIVDLRNTPDKYINRYLGKAGAQAFYTRWKKYESAA